MIQKGDKVYMIATRKSLIQKRILDTPLERKVIEVVFRNNKDTIYQLKGDSFPANWINKYVFTSKESAENKIKDTFKIF